MSAAEEKLDRLLIDVAAIKALLTSMSRAPASAPAATSEVASDYDLDSSWGDPVVKGDPKRWTGASYVGSRFSECPAEYLELLAGFFDWQAKKDDEQGKTYVSKKTGEKLPTSPLKRKDAARARGWAQRIKAGYVQTTREPATEEQPDIPF